MSYIIFKTNYNFSLWGDHLLSLCTNNYIHIKYLVYCTVVCMINSTFYHKTNKQI